MGSGNCSRRGASSSANNLGQIGWGGGQFLYTFEFGANRHRTTFVSPISVVLVTSCFMKEKKGKKEEKKTFKTKSHP